MRHKKTPFGVFFFGRYSSRSALNPIAHTFPLGCVWRHFNPYGAHASGVKVSEHTEQIMRSLVCISRQSTPNQASTHQFIGRFLNRPQGQVLSVRA